VPFAAGLFTASHATVVEPLNDVSVTAHGKALVAQGLQIFRYDTFGDQAFWAAHWSCTRPSRARSSAASVTVSRRLPLSLGLTSREKSDIVEYLKSLPD
jgi:hypothetical protein